MGAVGTPKYNPTEWDVYITGCLNVDSDDEKAQHFYTPDEMKYYKEWNWLMPVVEKINYLTDDNYKFLYNFTITGSWCEVTYTNGEGGFINNEHGATFVEMIYLTVVEFIKWYNQKKED